MWLLETNVELFVTMTDKTPEIDQMDFGFQLVFVLLLFRRNSLHVWMFALKILLHFK